MRMASAGSRQSRAVVATTVGPLTSRRKRRIVRPDGLGQHNDEAFVLWYGGCLTRNIAPPHCPRYNGTAAGLPDGRAILRRLVNCRRWIEWERRMEKKRPQSKQPNIEREITSTNGQAEMNGQAGTNGQAELTRMAHRIAWTRMNGRNDALNPFAETQTSQPASAEERPG
jgi:hypothetical protein